MKSYKTLVFVALLGIMAAGCQKPEEQKPTDNKGTVWTLTVNASKGDDTKALDWGKDGSDKDILTPKWNAGEFVDVYFGNTKIGYLESEASDDGSTKLSGEIVVDGLTKNSDNTLMLLFPGSGDSETEKSFTYLNQKGSNPTGQIASTYDYALANITVYKGESSITPAGSASFTNQQSIYQFASNMTVSSFTITSANGKLVQNRTNNGGTWTSSYGPITVSTEDTYSTTDKNYYVALRNEFVPESGGTDEYFFSFINENDGALYEASKVIKNAAFDGNGVINGKLMKASISFSQKTIAQSAGSISQQVDVL